MTAETLKCSSSASDESRAARAALVGFRLANGQLGLVESLLGQHGLLCSRLGEKAAGFRGRVLGAFELRSFRPHVGPCFVVIQFDE